MVDARFSQIQTQTVEVVDKIAQVLAKNRTVKQTVKQIVDQTASRTQVKLVEMIQE